eukprot:6208048-Ditylum_brightwellii.AAC.1
MYKYFHDNKAKDTVSKVDTFITASLSSPKVWDVDNLVVDEDALLLTHLVQGALGSSILCVKIDVGDDKQKSNIYHS